MNIKTYIIDGYNLLRRGFDFGGGNRDLASQRSMLEVLLKEFQRSSPQTRVVLVYDGALDVQSSSLKSREEKKLKNFEILFSVPPQNADSLVLEECEKRRGYSQLIVVTSDFKDIVNKLRGKGLNYYSSEEFADQMEQTLTEKKNSRETPANKSKLPCDEKPDSVSEDEAKSWYEAFSSSQEVDEATFSKNPVSSSEELVTREEDLQELTENEAEEWYRIFSQPKQRPNKDE